VDGIVRAIAPDRRPFYDRFLADYGSIRKAEGRGSNNREYYLALPYQDLSERNSEQWRIRASTYRYFEKKLLQEGNLDILDLGAGNGWMSYRLAQRGHRPVAVDIFTDAQDGLAAAREYDVFPTVEAEFDRLPFASGQFDLAIFNSSLHYSTDYHGTLGEARRCLKPSGSIVVLDSPLYKLREHGELMRSERHRQFQSQYGFASDSIANLEYLYESQLTELSRDLGLRWQIYEPWYGWNWLFRPLKARLQGRRPPSRFCILVASFPN
jgi:ubiquinone/menaquinone biosynthesis C-methylase UbiE